MTPEHRKRILDAYAAVFSHPQAGVVLFDLMENAQFWTASFRNSNPEGTAYGEGKRSLLQRILEFSGHRDMIRDKINPTWRTENEPK